MLKLLCLALATTLASADILTCTFRMMNNWRLTNVYTCYGGVIYDTESPDITDVIGLHMFGMSAADVTGIRMESRGVKAFPRNCETFFPNLISLGIINGFIETLTVEDLANYPKLIQLDLNNNLIKELPPNIFAANPLLQQITFTKNPMLNMAPHIFDDLTALGLLDLRGVPCLDREETTRTGVVIMLLSVEESCPPTDEMMQGITENNVAPCRERVLALEDEIPPKELALEGVEVQYEVIDARITTLAARLEQYITVLNVLVDTVNA